MREKRLKARKFWAILLSLAMVTSGWTPASIAYATEAGGEEVLALPEESTEGTEEVVDDQGTEDVEEIVDEEEAPAIEDEQVEEPQVIQEDAEALQLTTMADSVAQIGETGYDTFEDAVAAANDMTGDVTIKLLDDVTWTTGAEHGSTPLLTADSLATSLTIVGNGHTLTADGDGVGALRAANGGTLNFSDMTIKDESVSYNENAWELRYLEFGGKLNFADVEFTNGIMLTHVNKQQPECVASFENCKFSTPLADEYDVWIAQGSATFKGCSFTGSRGPKIHEAYGSEVGTVTFTECSFGPLSVKPGVVIGTVNADTTVIIDNCSLKDVQPGNQKKHLLDTDTGIYILESDTVLADFNLILKNSVKVDGVEALVARIGEIGYLTVPEGFAAAKADDTLEILKAGTYTLPNLPENITVQGNVDGVIFEHKTAGNVASVPNGATFKDVTFNLGNVNYHGFQHAGAIAMEGCTINGKLFSYAGMRFTGCTFNAPASDYSMWTYAGNVSYDGCTFNGDGKFVNVYNEDGATRYTVDATGCKFNSTTANEAAFNVKETCGAKVLQYTVNISGCTTTGGFPEAGEKGALKVLSALAQVDDRVAGGTENGGEIIVNVDGTEVYRTPAKTYAAAIGETQYATLQDAIDTAHEMTGDVTVTLLEDVTEVAVIHQKDGLNLTIDGAGKTITGQLYVDGDGRYNGTDTLTIQNVKFAYDAASYDEAFIYVPSTKTAGKVYTTGKYNYAHNLTVTACEFAGSDETTVAVRVASNAGAHDVVLSNNTVTDGHSFAQLTGVKDLKVTGNTVTGVKNGINISGGDGTATISGNTLTANATEGYTVRVKDNSAMNVTLDENTFSGGEGVVNKSTAGSNITILSGKYAGPLTTENTGKIVVSGGVFSEPVAAELCAEGLVPKANTDEATKADYPYTVGEAVYVAAIGDAKYETLEEAVAAAKGGDTITLLDDCSGNGIVVPQGKFAQGLTVDFAGHAYTVDGTPVGSTGTETIGFQLLKDNNIIFKNGTIAGSSRTNENLLRLVQNYSNLTLDGMTLNLEGRYYDQTTMSSCNGATVIKGSTVNAPDFNWAGIAQSSAVGGVALSVGTFSSYTAASVDVQGTSNINGDVNVDPTNEGATALTLSSDAITVTGDIKMLDNAATASTVTKNNGLTDVAAPDGYKWVDNGDGTSTLKVVEYVAQIGETKYETLVEAVAAAKPGETVTLLADASGAGIFVGQNDGKDVTIDLNKHTYTVDGAAVGSTGTATQALHLEKNNTIVIKNGTITSTADSGVKMIVQNYSDLTLEDVTLDGSNLPGSGQYVLSTNNGHTVIDGSTIKAKSGDFAFDACTGWGTYTSNTVEVTGESEITGDIEVSFYGLGTAPTLTLMGGTHDGAIVMARDADQATVTKANTYVQDAPEGYEWVDNGNETSTLKKKCVDHVDVDPADGICDKCGERIGSYVTVTSSGNGSVSGDSVATVSGGGLYQAGQSVTVSTAQVSGYTFKGWFSSDQADAVSTSLDYTFTADGKKNYNLVAVYEPAATGTGFDLEVVASKFTVTGFSATQRSRMNTKVKADTSVTVKFTGSEHFLYWINSSNKVVSKSETYTFTMVQDTELTAVYSDADTTTEAMVLFLSSETNGQLMSSYYCNTTDPIDFPHAPSNLGKVFKFWSIDGSTEATTDTIHAAIANAKDGRVEVYPVYESSGKYGVTIKFVDENGTEIKDPDSTTYANIEIGNGKDVVAPADIDGKKFAYWQDEDGATLSYTASFYVRPTKDVTLTAVYANDVVAQPTLVMTEAFSSMNGSKYRVSFTATRSVPAGYTIESVGILYARAENLDTSSDEAIKHDLVLDSENGNVKNLKGTSTTLNGTTTGNINTSVSDRVFYARGYLVVKGSAGTQYIYTDSFLYGSFDSLGQ